MLLVECSPVLSVPSTQTCVPVGVAPCSQQITPVGSSATGCNNKDIITVCHLQRLFGNYYTTVLFLEDEREITEKQKKN